eukprot:CAMPEP_0115111068 /NCGR_PEP_ID=MMETSP0227-20121206/39794_1 /TAXON_ID=89957 /ORGANISM="Polarella glacialis, Strain CCMP 1383" /LENGTH=128 /DNA_ID=CAMNT_0002510313 /DNA_START=77 /DNA_END=459 /DNA_ORIENTATION=+
MVATWALAAALCLSTLSPARSAGFANDEFGYTAPIASSQSGLDPALAGSLLRDQLRYAHFSPQEERQEEAGELVSTEDEQVAGGAAPELVGSLSDEAEASDYLMQKLREGSKVNLKAPLGTQPAFPGG